MPVILVSLLPRVKTLSALVCRGPRRFEIEREIT
jgi:hypothetical protein